MKLLCDKDELFSKYSIAFNLFIFIIHKIGFNFFNFTTHFRMIQCFILTKLLD